MHIQSRLLSSTACVMLLAIDHKFDDIISVNRMNPIQLDELNLIRLNELCMDGTSGFDSCKLHKTCWGRLVAAAASLTLPQSWVASSFSLCHLVSIYTASKTALGSRHWQTAALFVSPTVERLNVVFTANSIDWRNNLHNLRLSDLICPLFNSSISASPCHIEFSLDFNSSVSIGSIGVSQWFACPINAIGGALRDCHKWRYCIASKIRRQQWELSANWTNPIIRRWAMADRIDPNILWIFGVLILRRLQCWISNNRVSRTIEFELFRDVFSRDNYWIMASVALSLLLFFSISVVDVASSSSSSSSLSSLTSSFGHIQSHCSQKCPSQVCQLLH